MTDPVPAIPAIQPTPPSAPSQAHLCRLYGKLTTIDGRPDPFKGICVWLHPVLDTAVLVDAVMLSGHPVKSVTNRSGEFYFDVPKESGITVLLPGLRRHYTMEVPDLDVAPLFPHLFPHPVLLSWCGADPELRTCVQELTFLTDGFGNPINEINAPIDTDVYFGISVEFSNGVKYRVQSLEFEIPEAGNPDVTISQPDVDTICIRKSLAGDVTLISLLEESLGTTGQLWVRVGYLEEYPPYFLPPSSHELDDAQDLIIHFS